MGDCFRAQVGFLTGAGGEVDFVINVGSQEAGRIPDIATDGSLRTFDIDLSGYAGSNQITLIVEAGASAGQDWAVWVGARIER
jgi:hypothetical protein